jgi:hypothetical protein
MMKPYAVMVFPALALLTIGQQAPAQLVSKLEAGAIVANRDGVLREDIFSLTPSLRWERPNYRLSASGSAWRVGEQWQLAGGEASGTLVTPRVFSMQGEVTARASRIFYDPAATAERLDALARVHLLLQDRGGFWIGGGVDRPWRVAVASTIDVSAGGAWTKLGPATLSGSVTNFFFSKVTATRDSSGQQVACGAHEESLPTAAGPGTSSTVLPPPAARVAASSQECRRQSRFSDVQAGIQWAHEALELSATAGYRLGDSYDVTPESRRWASAVATFWITNQLAAVAGAGRQPASPAHGLPARSYASFGMMLAYWPIPRRTVPVAPRATVAAFSIVSSNEAPSMERTIVVRAGGIEKLEVMGSFTGWEPRQLSRFGRDHWELTLPIGTGLHEINIRTDGGKWRPPPGLPTRRDGFNGEVGILVIE